MVKLVLLQKNPFFPARTDFLQQNQHLSMERSFFFVASPHDHIRHLMPFEKGRSTSSASGQMGLFVSLFGSEC